MNWGKDEGGSVHKLMVLVNSGLVCAPGAGRNPKQLKPSEVGG